ncbi:MAG: hypothetical protein P8M04_01035 [Akkermansiaceae bacterium]|nr:hypothetical protein [Akkermansiaceae bacterium]
MTEMEDLTLQESDDSDLIHRLNKLLSGPSCEEFSPLALDIFKFQFDRNRPYAAFARSLEKTPETVSRWQEIPAVPTAAFKLSDFPLTCGREILTTFSTSGTTTETKGSHHFPFTHLYEKAISHGWPLPKLPTFFLASSALESPQSSLSHMFGHLNDGNDSRFLLKNSKFRLGRLFLHLASGQPLILMGTALAFRHLMEVHGSIPLPPGSHLLETGGYKGTSIALSKPEFYHHLSEFFKLTPDHLHNEYGMTELSSQAYATGPNGPHRFPHWCRHLILDPETEREVAPGETGYLVIHDLANLHSVCGIRTQDFATRHEDNSFTLIGRDPGALPRGCSRTIDQALSS